MINSLELIIGLAVGTGLVALYYFVMMKRGGTNVDRYRMRMRQALTIFGVATVLAIMGKIIFGP
jgi:hypothetical protein